jgi:hypothetical protein
MERKILWDKTSHNYPERHTYRILIYNETREIIRISQRLKEYLQPIVEWNILAEGKISGGEYQFIEIETPKNTEVFSQVYKGKIRKDRRLEKRRTDQGESNLVEMISKEEI